MLIIYYYKLERITSCFIGAVCYFYHVCSLRSEDEIFVEFTPLEMCCQVVLFSFSRTVFVDRRQCRTYTDAGVFQNAIVWRAFRRRRLRDDQSCFNCVTDYSVRREHISLRVLRVRVCSTDTDETNIIATRTESVKSYNTVQILYNNIDENRYYSPGVEISRPLSFLFTAGD